MEIPKTLSPTDCKGGRLVIPTEVVRQILGKQLEDAQQKSKLENGGSFTLDVLDSDDVVHELTLDSRVRSKGTTKYRYFTVGWETFCKAKNFQSGSVIFFSWDSQFAMLRIAAAPVAAVPAAVGPAVSWLSKRYRSRCCIIRNVNLVNFRNAFAIFMGALTLGGVLRCMDHMLYYSSSRCIMVPKPLSDRLPPPLPFRDVDRFIYSALWSPTIMVPSFQPLLFLVTRPSLSITLPERVLTEFTTLLARNPGLIPRFHTTTTNFWERLSDEMSNLLISNMINSFQSVEISYPSVKVRWVFRIGREVATLLLELTKTGSVILTDCKRLATKHSIPALFPSAKRRR